MRVYMGNGRSRSLSSRGDADVFVAGAKDCLTKPFEPADLKIRLRTAVRIIHMQEELANRGGASYGKPCKRSVAGAEETTCPSHPK